MTGLCHWKLLKERIQKYFLSKNTRSHIRAHSLLNLLNELRKRDKMRGFPGIYLFCATRLINSINQEQE